MNNSAPLWLTVVLAAIASASALIAALLTTWLNSRYGYKRLSLEIKHQRSQESRKLLFDQRLATYANMLDIVTTQTRILDEAVSLIIKAPLDKRRAMLPELQARLLAVTKDRPPFVNEVRLVASQDVLGSHTRYLEFLSKTVRFVLKEVHEGEFNEWDSTREEFNAMIANLALQMQVDLGAEGLEDD